MIVRTRIRAPLFSFRDSLYAVYNIFNVFFCFLLKTQILNKIDLPYVVQTYYLFFRVNDRYYYHLRKQLSNCGLWTYSLEFWQTCSISFRSFLEIALLVPCQWIHSEDFRGELCKCDSRILPEFILNRWPHINDCFSCLLFLYE